MLRQESATIGRYQSKKGTGRGQGHRGAVKAVSYQDAYGKRDESVKCERNGLEESPSQM